MLVVQPGCFPSTRLYEPSRCWSELSLMVIATQAVRPGVVLDQTAALVDPSPGGSGGCVGHHRL
jgi:hypothetical protein